MKTQIGESLTCDFEENTWTFEMEDNFEVTAGEFMIIPKELFKQQIIDAYESGQDGTFSEPINYYTSTFETNKEALK